MIEKLRIDKYLWSIRAYKTRTLATDACKAGRVKKNGSNVKASYEVKEGDIFTVSKAAEKKTIKITGLLHTRVDAKKAVLFYEDLTPEEDKLSYKTSFMASNLKRDVGTGRPTKKDRRDIDTLKENWFDDV
ncbi:MAG: RNA-binding S4 domain-containing protein [Sphingobacteriales bacterium]|nr:MAG: RNA-binding S4 domain-containing protein [Sphingobacteriales bacterium]